VTDKTNIYIDGEHAATIENLQKDAPWYFGTLIPGEAFEELKESLDKAPYSVDNPEAIELKAGQDTVDRVSWGADVDTSDVITQLTLARYEADGQWELEFTCDEIEEDAEANDEAAESTV
jgi:hypothetical protein